MPAKETRFAGVSNGKNQQQQSKTSQPNQPGRNVPRKSNLKINGGTNGVAKNGTKNGNKNQQQVQPAASHVTQNTAVMAGESLPTNSVQNYLIGKSGENVAENVLHLFREYYVS